MRAAMDGKAAILPERRAFTIKLFGATLRTLWVLLAAMMIFAEVIPMPLIPPVPFYAYVGSKLIGFAILGYLTPLTFWRFGSLGRGVAFGLLSTAGIETIQGLIEGHRFSFFEMFVKLSLLLIGFGLALLARYDKHIHVGRLHIGLDDQHWRE